jgi:HAD superfamily hydrolase (TIGR01509 family)
VTALILDCDGVLAETERELHLPAFNRAFEELGLPLRWSVEEYGERLQVAGGKERIASALTPGLVAAVGVPFEPTAVRALAARIHDRKTEIAAALFEQHPPRPRPGIRRVVRAAHAAGWKLAIASTSAEASVRSVVRAVFEPTLAGELLILAGDVVPAKKPAPDIYELALGLLEVPRAEAIVVEDSRNGLLAATGAGVTCVVTVSEYSAGEDFGESPLVVSSLGDPGDPLTVVANRSSLTPSGELTLEELRLLARECGGVACASSS